MPTPRDPVDSRDPSIRGGAGADPGVADAPRRLTAERVALVVLGLFSVILAVVVLAEPSLTIDQLFVLLAGAVTLNSARTVLAGGRLFWSPRRGWEIPRWGRTAFRDLGVLGIGLVAAGIAITATFFPDRALTLAVLLLALALVVQGLGRVVEGLDRRVARWLPGSSVVTGALMVTLVVAAIAFDGLAVFAFAVLIGVILLVSGIETVVEGLHPTDPRQFVLLKLILFAAFYGLVLINWIDLFGKTVPAYGVWLVLTYMAPFAVMLVFLGWEAWPLATSLGLLVSLMNDVGYFFIGNLLFGFHEPLGIWIAGQLGFRGSYIVTTFQGGSFAIDVPSWLMGLSIYLRGIFVALILYYWWRQPAQFGPADRRVGARPTL